VFTHTMPTFCEPTMGDVCADPDAELVEFTGEADHLHLLLAHPPTPAISTLMQRLKGRTAHTTRRELTSACVPARIRRHPCSPSYLAVSRPGPPLPIMNQYIHGQTRPL
jgi:putative transposase